MPVLCRVATKVWSQGARMMLTQDRKEWAFNHKFKQCVWSCYLHQIIDIMEVNFKTWKSTGLLYESTKLLQHNLYEFIACFIGFDFFVSHTYMTSWWLATFYVNMEKEIVCMNNLEVFKDDVCKSVTYLNRVTYIWVVYALVWLQEWMQKRHVFKRSDCVLKIW